MTHKSRHPAWEWSVRDGIRFAHLGSERLASLHRGIGAWLTHFGRGDSFRVVDIWSPGREALASYVGAIERIVACFDALDRDDELDRRALKEEKDLCHAFRAGDPSGL